MTEEPQPSASATVRPSPSPLRWMIPLMLVLGVVMVIVWATRPKQTAVYDPPPPPVKTVAEVEKMIADVKANKRMPESEKGRILGFLQGDLEKAKKNQ